MSNWIDRSIAFVSGVVVTGAVGYLTYLGTISAQRPYVKLSAARVLQQNVPARGGMSFLVDVSLTGAGASPATEVSYWVSPFWARDPDDLRSDALHRRRCADGLGELPDRFTIFPGETKTSRFLTSMSEEEASAARIPAPKAGRNAFAAFLIICAYYDDPTAGKHHTSSAVYMLSKRTGSNSENWSPIGNTTD